LIFFYTAFFFFFFQTLGRKRYGVLADTVLQPASPNVVWEMRRLRYSDAIQAQKERVTKMSKEICVIAGAVGSCTAVVGGFMLQGICNFVYVGGFTCHCHHHYRLLLYF
jgi:hypothetical protein